MQAMVAEQPKKTVSNLSTSPYIDLPKFVDRVDATTQLCISSVSFGEFIARYRYNAKIIRRTCSFMLWGFYSFLTFYNKKASDGSPTPDLLFVCV